VIFVAQPFDGNNFFYIYNVITLPQALSYLGMTTTAGPAPQRLPLWGPGEVFVERCTSHDEFCGLPQEVERRATFSYFFLTNRLQV
jgi:hypothetical protein